ncbi:uncharacterized protein [Ambystoma mexicanum]|uniref:uncharacterized protein isoform X1 n=1 Tax=Ambystoma mexicanum TaxID=8296 RepID=UPI0037E893F0
MVNGLRSGRKLRDTLPEFSNDSGNTINESIKGASLSATANMGLSMTDVSLCVGPIRNSCSRVMSKMCLLENAPIIQHSIGVGGMGLTDSVESVATFKINDLNDCEEILYNQSPSTTSKSLINMCVPALAGGTSSNTKLADVSIIPPGIEAALGNRMRFSKAPSTPVTHSRFGIENVHLFNNLDGSSQSMSGTAIMCPNKLMGRDYNKVKSSSPTDTKINNDPIHVLSLSEHEIAMFSASQNPDVRHLGTHNVIEQQKSCNESMATDFPVMTRLLNLLDKGHEQTHGEIGILKGVLVDVLSKISRIEGFLFACDAGVMGIKKVVHLTANQMTLPDLKLEAIQPRIEGIHQASQTLADPRMAGESKPSFAAITAVPKIDPKVVIEPMIQKLSLAISANVLAIQQLTNRFSDLPCDLPPADRILREMGGTEEGQHIEGSEFTSNLSDLTNLIDLEDELYPKGPSMTILPSPIDSQVPIGGVMTRKQRKMAARAQKRKFHQEKNIKAANKQIKNDFLKANALNEANKKLCFPMIPEEQVIDLEQLNPESKELLNLPESCESTGLKPKGLRAHNSEMHANLKPGTLGDITEAVQQDTNLELANLKQSNLLNFFPNMRIKKASHIMKGGSGPRPLKEHRKLAQKQVTKIDTKEPQGGPRAPSHVSGLIDSPTLENHGGEIIGAEAPFDILPDEADLQLSPEMPSIMGWESNETPNGKTRLNRSAILKAFQDIPALRTIRSDDIDWVRLSSNNNNRMICGYHSHIIMRMIWAQRTNFELIGLTPFIFQNEDLAKSFVEKTVAKQTTQMGFNEGAFPAPLNEELFKQFMTLAMACSGIKSTEPPPQISSFQNMANK